MMLHTQKQKWNLFSRNVLPLPNPKKMQSMSISQIDSFAASVIVVAETYEIDLKILKFNRLEGIFEYEYKYVEQQKNRFGRPSLAETEFEIFMMLVLFLKHLYNIDTKNEFVRNFIQFGSQLQFEKFWNAATCEWIYAHFKPIKQTHELAYKFFKKIGLGNDYLLAVDHWDKENLKESESLYK